MFQNLFSNIGNITKNLLIINVLFFLAKFILESQGIPLGRMLGLYYPSSQYFEPYQLATHFFMHSDFRHILFNMLGLVFLGSNLERFWGPKKFFIFYVVTALGAAILHMFVQGIEIYNATDFWFPELNIDLAAGIAQSAVPMDGIGFAAEVYMIPTVGASGAIYGLIMAYAVLFPNTEFMLYFAIPVKAKWLALGAGLYALYQGYQNSAGDSVAHFAHLGGMLFAFILIKIWQKQRNQFY